MLKTIWQDDDYYKLPPLTDKAVEGAEEELKVKLPESYIDLLKEQNGGYINYNAFPSSVSTSWVENHIKIDHILGVGEEAGILQSEYLINEWDLPTNIVLFSGEGHSWVAFDYRNTREEPPIVYIDSDSEQIIELAPDFETFLKGLFVEEEKEEKLEEPYSEPDVSHWTLDDVDTVLSTNNEQEVILALNFLCERTQGNEIFIEQKLIVLLQNPILEIKQLAVNYAEYFYKIGLLSPRGVEEMVTIIRLDKEIEYFADMYFSEN